MCKNLRCLENIYGKEVFDIENTNNYSVYIHEFPDGKIYVGLTKQNPQKRWNNGNGYRCQPVYKAILKYGWDNIKHIIVKDNLSETEARELEIKLINDFDSINTGYNVSPGGGIGGNSWILIDYKDDTYSPEELLQFSSVNNLTAHDITTRLGHGWSIEDVLNKPKVSRRKKYNYRGKLYTSKELYDKFNHYEKMSYKIFVSRLSNNWDIDRALMQPTNTKMEPLGCRNKNVEVLTEYNGKLYKSYELAQMSSIDGITSAQIMDRIRNHGWSVEKALTTPIKKYGKLYEFNGQMYSSKELAAMSPYPDISHHTITDRINKSGWSVYDAIYTPKGEKPTNKIA